MAEFVEVTMFGKKYRTDRWDFTQLLSSVNITLYECEEMVELPKKKLDELTAKAQSQEQEEK